MDPGDSVRAAQYVRMSTEHQRYSVEFQTTTNAAYALEHGLTVVRTYLDAGISGLTLKGRDGLKALIADVVAGRADFTVILVFDVSRWGRFQDPDQAAHYEFICKEAGVAIKYCTEPFVNDGSALSSIVKSMKRAMAAEYSRELSEKIGRSMRGLSAKGYWTGGQPALGLRRQPIAHDGRPRPVLQLGEANGVRGDRLTLVPGPDHEVALVRRIFRDYLSGLSLRTIAEHLNAEEVPTVRDKAWTPWTIRCILRNEAYAGAYVTGKTRCRLGVVRKQPRHTWVRVDNAFEPIVPKWLFEAVHRQLRKWHGHATDEELLAELAAFMARSPDVSTASLRGDPRMRCATTYAKRFGSLKEAYRLIGYVKPRRDPEEIRLGRNARRRARDAQTALTRRQAKRVTS